MSVHRRYDHSYPSLLTTTCADRQPLFRRAEAARLFIENLYAVRTETTYKLLAFVVMPDHVHLVVVPSAGHALGQVVQLIKGRFARVYNSQVGSSGSLWQSRYHESALLSEQALVWAVEYVHENPVAGGLVASAEEYPWSSARAEFETDLESYLMSG